jgi:ribosomal protein L37AE/L43A
MITKKPKCITVLWKKVVYTRIDSEYQCPSCRTFFVRKIDDNVSRFFCQCGQELIVSNRITTAST